MRRLHSLTAAALLLAPLPACTQAQEGVNEDETEAAAAADTGERAGGATATYDIVDADGRKIGRVELADGAGGLLLRIAVEGLEPGLHGLHVHETGRCETPDFVSAGGHWAPGGGRHGFLAEGGPHAGDLPNLSVAGGGDPAVQHVFAPGLSIARLTEGDGSALLIHGGADDYRSQPSGAAGARVACAAIRTG